MNIIWSLNKESKARPELTEGWSFSCVCFSNKLTLTIKVPQYQLRHGWQQDSVLLELEIVTEISQGLFLSPFPVSQKQTELWRITDRQMILFFQFLVMCLYLSPCVAVCVCVCVSGRWNGNSGGELAYGSCPWQWENPAVVRAGVLQSLRGSDGGSKFSRRGPASHAHLPHRQGSVQSLAVNLKKHSKQC